MTFIDKVTFQHKTLLNFINEARSLYDRKHFTDVTLQCEGEIFPVHKLVLAANSPYFRDYFIQKPDLTLTNISVDFLTSEVLQIILNYFYTGEIFIKNQQTPTLVKSLIEASSILQIPLLSNYCLELLLEKSSSQISLSDWKVIEEHNNKIVFDCCLRNIIKKLTSFNTTQDFLQLTVNQINTLFQYLAAGEYDLNIVLQSILNWVKYDSDERKEQLTELLQTFVDWKKLNPDLLLELKKEQLLLENVYFLQSCFKLLCQENIVEPKEDIKSKSLQNNKNMEVETESIVEAKTLNQEIQCFGNELNYFQKPTFHSFSEEIIFFIYGFKHENRGEIVIYLYDYVKDELNEMIAHPLIFIKDATILYRNGNVYTFGGRTLDDKRISREVFSYNKEIKQWLRKEYMVNFKYRSSAVELKGYMYVVGGIHRNEHLKCVERYNPSTDEWKSVAELPDVNEDTLPVVAVNDCLYIVLKTKLYKYIPEEDKWNSLDIDLDKYIEGEVHICGGNDKIFVIEKTKPKYVWIYDCKENKINEDIIPAIITECDGMLNLKNNGNLEFLVSGNEKWFIYRPPHLWTPFDPKKLKDFDISMLTLIHH